VLSPLSSCFPLFFVFFLVMAFFWLL
jgi:hypothetical protein